MGCSEVININISWKEFWLVLFLYVTNNNIKSKSPVKTFSLLTNQYENKKKHFIFIFITTHLQQEMLNNQIIIQFTPLSLLVRPSSKTWPYTYLCAIVYTLSRWTTGFILVLGYLCMNIFKMFLEYFWNIFGICFGICFKSTWIFYMCFELICLFA